MANVQVDQLAQMETTCGSLLYELQLIWDEVGEPDTERDRMLLELEQECLEVYKRKVALANRARAQLRQAIAEAEAELVTICSVMGERPVHIRQCNQNAGNLKEELKAIIPQLEEMRKRRSDRLNQFLEVRARITKIIAEIRPSDHSSKIEVDETDLSERRLEELNKHLQSLEKEKSDRLKQVLDYSTTLNSLCTVLGMDFKQTVREVHPTLDDNEGSKNISNDTIERLASATQRLREVKIQRMQKLQDLATTMLELWNLMDTPVEEQQLFQNVTCNIAASEHEITEPNTLSADFINYVGEEVSRLEQLKSSKMKDLVLKKKTELEELRRRTHLVTESDNDTEFPLDAIEAGAIDASLVLEQIEVQISSVKEEAFSRKDILERVEKWLAACEEESWLEEYNRDENRYSAGRGAHLALKRAEKARAMINKIPGSIEALSAKVIAWESERGAEFIYDGVNLLSMLEEYMVVRQEKEEERKRLRDQKRLQGQLIAEQEALFGSKPSPSSRPQSAKKGSRTSTGGAAPKRLSLGGGAIMQPPKTDPLSSAKSSRSNKKGDEGSDISPGRRGPDFASLAAKKLPFNTINTREVDSPRKPFTPLAGVNSIPVMPSAIHMEAEAYKNPMVTPTQSLPATPKTVSEANRTPIVTPLPSYPSTPRTVSGAGKTPMVTPTPSRPTTPKTVAEPMQVATTPAPACFLQEAAITQAHEIEYSFEERRLDVYLKRS